MWLAFCKSDIDRVKEPDGATGWIYFISPLNDEKDSDFILSTHRTNVLDADGKNCQNKLFNWLQVVDWRRQIKTYPVPIFHHEREIGGV